MKEHVSSFKISGKDVMEMQFIPSETNCSSSTTEVKASLCNSTVQSLYQCQLGVKDVEDLVITEIIRHQNNFFFADT